ncbi:Crp/Fnr family transcriptional regulator [Flavobacterium silvaticum]|uniref:Crp/Fnr family transcriptional regulator n=1 Tax=Flavobacterium silvaticum TaxID=1852020 RepID=A0A972JIB5_9FLAO|nr:Crp/Fnr family transcriptional regulator [Flavobacterium silvaticum]NMH28033.1 Crp/Fnr family transcriptional regulator [Flavobacterium silvaticum]
MHRFRQHLEEIISLTDEEFEQIQSFFVYKKYKKHQVILEEGDLAKNEYLVLSGLLKSSFTDADGKEHILQFAWENWWITDYNAFWKRENSILSIECLEDVEVLSLSLEDKTRLHAEFRKMEQFFLKKSNAGYVGLQKRVLSLLTNSAEKRFEQLIATYPQLLQRVPKKLIAAYLGVSRETLSRLSGK